MQTHHNLRCLLKLFILERMQLKQKFVLVFILLFSANISHAQIDFLFKDAQKPDNFKAPFVIKDSLIIVSAIVNNKPEQFLLDNGCPYLVMNTLSFKNKVRNDSTITARGIGGSIQKTGTTFLQYFDWNGIKKDSFNVVALPLPNLGKNVSGIIGHDLFKDYSMRFEFDSSIIAFSKSQNKSAFVSDSTQDVFVPFQYSKHLPIISIIINKDTLLAGLDCGATGNMIYESKLDSLKDSLKISYTILRGAGSTPLPVKKTVIPEIQIQDIGYKNVSFLFDDASINQINESLPVKIDAILGMPFFKRFNITIDFPNRLLTILQP